MHGLIDTTLREGAQTVGVHFDLDARLALVDALCAVGIEEIEIGISTVFDPELPALMAGCRRRHPRQRFALWSRCREEDIAVAARLRPDILSLSIPVSDLHIEKKLRKSRPWVLAAVIRAVRQAKAAGITTISLGLEDASRADPAFVATTIEAAARAGVRRVRYADTVGIATPAAMADAVRGVPSCGLEVGVHCHNDFGMAGANAIAAIEAGAHWADVTLLGLGERAGNARTEEVAGFFALRAGRSYRTEALPAACALTARLAGETIPRRAPLVGAAIFTCESGLHLHGLATDPATYEPYPPEAVRQSRRLFHGAKSGRRALGHRLAALLPGRGTTAVSPALLRRCRDLATRAGRPLHDHELLRLCAKD